MLRCRQPPPQAGKLCVCVCVCSRTYHGVCARTMWACVYAYTEAKNSEGWIVASPLVFCLFMVRGLLVDTLGVDAQGHHLPARAFQIHLRHAASHGHEQRALMAAAGAAGVAGAGAGAGASAGLFPMVCRRRDRTAMVHAFFARRMYTVLAAK